MYYILLFAIVLLPQYAFADSSEIEATRVCSEYIRIKKLCYYKALKGVLPVKGIKGVKSKLPKEFIEGSCNEGYYAFGRAGKLKPEILNQAMQLNYSKCFDSYVNKLSCREASNAIRDAVTLMEAYYVDYQKYPDHVPYKEEANSLPPQNINVSLIDSNEQDYTVVVSSDKCNKIFKKKATDSKIVETYK